MSLKNVLIIVDNIDESIDFYEELFVDCDKDYIRFHLEGRPNIRTLGNLKQLEERSDGSTE